MPELSVHSQALVRVLFGVLWLGTLITLIPNFKRFFLAEKWGGYADHTGLNKILQHPAVFPVVIAIWFASAILLILGWWTVPVAFLNMVLCYQFFIRQRWSSLLRGMGAPGFMTWWLSMAIFLLELTSRYAPAMHSWALLALQLDFAIIMFSAGFYKMTSGYPAGVGMELGMVNPMWGYWTGFFRKMPSDHWIFFFLNQMAWITEIVGALLMFIPRPETRLLGALFIAGSFAFVATQIRLNLLTEMVIISCFLFIPAGHFTDQWVAQWLPAAPIAATPVAWLENLLYPLILAYMILRPLALLGLYVNFYFKKSWPQPFQRILEVYCNTFGIILWRVFTKEVTDFHIKIESQDKNGEWRSLAHYTSPADWRYNNVAESIAVATIFTALKYFSGNRAIFHQRLLRYVQTLPGQEVKRFQYVALRKRDGRFVEIPVLEFLVNPVQKTISESILDPITANELNPATYAAQECARPGSYVPVGN